MKAAESSPLLDWQVNKPVTTSLEKSQSPDIVQAVFEGVYVFFGVRGVVFVEDEGMFVFVGDILSGNGLCLAGSENVEVMVLNGKFSETMAAV